MVVSLLLSERCEATRGDSLKRTGESGALLYQTPPALQEDESAQLRTEPLEPERKSYLTQISQVTRLIMYKLWILIIDSLAMVWLDTH
jgi:hypothetical protein